MKHLLRENIKKNKKRVREILNILNIKQILDFIIFPIIALISICAKPFCKNIWIIQENQNEAVDNGYIFFKYLRQNRKDINVYYVINFKAKDYKKVEKLGNVIKYRSIKHWIYYINASKIIVTQKYANPSPALFYVLHVKNIIKTPRIFLQHGITKDDAQMYYFNRTKFRLFICGAKKEYEYVKEKFGYPIKNVVYTGFARFDNLYLNDNNDDNIEINKNTYNRNIEINLNAYNHNIEVNKNIYNQKLILIAPTWRKWIAKQEDFKNFMKSYYDLLNNKKLIKYLEKNNIMLQVVLHKNMKKFKVANQDFSKNIRVYHNEQVDIQNLLNKTDLLITDYSSIFFDIAYRKKPIIYYQFDIEKYREEQLAQGYFSYKNDGFGQIVNEVDSVVDKIKYYIENSFNIEKIYSERMDEFFERKDKNNCKRILEEIEKI